jgi:hypothetical protein
MIQSLLHLGFENYEIALCSHIDWRLSNNTKSKPRISFYIYIYIIIEFLVMKVLIKISSFLHYKSKLFKTTSMHPSHSRLSNGTKNTTLVPMIWEISMGQIKTNKIDKHNTRIISQPCMPRALEKLLPTLLIFVWKWFIFKYHEGGATRQHNWPTLPLGMA